VLAPALPTILLVAPDDALAYLMERYARHSRYRLQVQRAQLSADAIRVLRPAVVWYPSMEQLDHARPRERGLVEDDVPVIVCGEEADGARARDLGADHCARHPLTYPEFLAALSSVGLPGADGSRLVAR
jgi:hypothetical protein